MKILILAAMDKEIDLLINLLSEYKEEIHSDLKIRKGLLGEHEVFISKCGIGKVNSALNTYRLLELLHPDLVINSGVAGGAGLPIGTLLIADKVVYHDVWCGPGTIYGQADGVRLYMQPMPEILKIAENLKFTTGLICSGDKFISTKEEISFIRSKFPEVKAVDMESASIAQTCCMFGTPFAIVRIVSDTPGEGENISQYKDFWKNAPLKTFETLKTLLTELKGKEK